MARIPLSISSIKLRKLGWVLLHRPQEPKEAYSRTIPGTGTSKPSTTSHLPLSPRIPYLIDPSSIIPHNIRPPPTRHHLNLDLPLPHPHRSLIYSIHQYSFSKPIVSSIYTTSIVCPLTHLGRLPNHPLHPRSLRHRRLHPIYPTRSRRRRFPRPYRLRRRQ
jgi:hypothetical protein